jgi:hypothetical protein
VARGVAGSVGSCGTAPSAAHATIHVLLLSGGAMTAVTLLLLALLKDAEMRAEHVVRRKLDAIAEVLVDVY